jgi:hypothetical protein
VVNATVIPVALNVPPELIVKEAFAAVIFIVVPDIVTVPPLLTVRYPTETAEPKLIVPFTTTLAAVLVVALVLMVQPLPTVKLSLPLIAILTVPEKVPVQLKLVD